MVPETSPRALAVRYARVQTSLELTPVLCLCIASQLSLRVPAQPFEALPLHLERGELDGEPELRSCVPVCPVTGQAIEHGGDEGVTRTYGAVAPIAC